MDTFAPGDNPGGDHLVAHLNAHQSNPYIQTWQARAADGQEIVLKLCHYPGYAYRSPAYFHDKVEPLLDVPSMPSVVPFLDTHMIEWQGKPVLAIRRRYYPTRLMDLIPADAVHPPSRILLEVFAVLANCLDALEKQLPHLSFDLSPGDLLMDDDKLVITDFGMSRLLFLLEPDYRVALTGVVARTEPERGVPLLASYPSIGNMRGQTNAQFAMAALYLYFRSRFMIFEDPSDLFPKETKDFSRIKWEMKIF